MKKEHLYILGAVVLAGGLWYWHSTKSTTTIAATKPAATTPAATTPAAPAAKTA